MALGRHRDGRDGANFATAEIVNTFLAVQSARMHLACVVQQGCAVAVVLAVIDLADKNLVVTLGEVPVVAAFKHRDTVLQQGHAVGRVMKFGMCKAVRTFAGKEFSHRFLRRGQHMYRVVAALLKDRQCAGGRAKAPEYQRRCQRQRVKGADRESDGLALRTARRDDGDASGELTQGSAKLT